MYIFPTYFVKRNLQNHFLRKFLKALTNNMWCNVEIKNFNKKNRTQQLSSKEPSWLQLFQKYSRVEFFIGSQLQMLKVNDFDREGCRTFIVQFPCRKMNSFLFAQVIVEKAASSETLRWRTLYLFPCLGNP